MQKRYLILLAAGVLFLATKLVYAWWNPQELVTLHGKDIPVADALKSFSKQTRRTILYPATLDQKVTLNLDRVPLEDALDAATEQAELWHTRVFLLTSDSTRKKDLLAKLARQTEPPVLMRLARTGRWENAGAGNRQPGFVSYKTDAKSVDAVIAELNLATNSYFYFSSDFSGPLTLDWKDVPIRNAAEQLASMTKTGATRLYQVFDRDRPQAGDNRPRRASPFSSPEDILKWAQKTTDEIAALPPAEKAAAGEQWKVQQERMKEFASLSEEQRLDRMMQRFTGGNQEERLIRRLKNSTPEQRAKRYQRFEARRRARDGGTLAPVPVPKTSPPSNP